MCCGNILFLFIKNLTEIQEGDPKYLAPEVLRGIHFITSAADIFSLGLTILELATDLELPNGGETYIQTILIYKPYLLTNM